MREEEEENLFISPQKYTIMIHMQNETLQGKETSIKTLKVAVMDVTCLYVHTKAL